MSKLLKSITEDYDSKAYHRAHYILTLRGGVSTKSPGDEKVYLSLNNYLNNQLMMVLSFVDSGSMGSICDNIWLKR